jgi:hypothetical protein
VIEECETKMRDFLEDLGFDVIGVPLRSLNEFGGGVHCVTWGILFSPPYQSYFHFRHISKGETLARTTSPTRTMKLRKISI